VSNGIEQIFENHGSNWLTQIYPEKCYLNRCCGVLYCVLCSFCLVRQFIHAIVGLAAGFYIEFENCQMPFLMPHVGPGQSPLLSLHLLLYLLICFTFPFLTRLVYFLAFLSLPILPE